MVHSFYGPLLPPGHETTRGDTPKNWEQTGDIPRDSHRHSTTVRRKRAQNDERASKNLKTKCGPDIGPFFVVAVLQVFRRIGTIEKLMSLYYCQILFLPSDTLKRGRRRPCLKTKSVKKPPPDVKTDCVALQAAFSLTQEILCHHSTPLIACELDI